MTTDLVTQDLPATINVDREMTVKELKAQSMKIHQVLEAVMVKDIHYGVIPGTEKPTLYQAGAEKICATFRLAPKYDVEDLSEPNNNFYRYRVKCSLYYIRDGNFVGSAMGEASTAEEKYQWERAVNQKHWDTTDVDRRRIKFKKNKDADGGAEEILQVQRNCADLANTVLKIACKRAFTSATKGATAASDLLDVDLDEEQVAELNREQRDDTPKMKAKPKPINVPKFPYGKHKGKSITDPEVTMDDLNWWHDRLMNDLKEGKNKQYEKANREFVAAIASERLRREKQPTEPEQQDDAPKDPKQMDTEAWVDLCQLWYDTQPDAYTTACEEFKTNDASKLPNGKWAKFKARIDELTK